MMTWMETLELLGLDLMAFMLLAVVALDVVDHAVHSAWVTAHMHWGARKPAPRRVRRPHVTIGGVHHV